MEKLRAILIHLLRNAVDHGCETEQERIAANKPPEARISLKAFNQGDNVVIELHDDGMGIDIAGIKQKAIQKHLLTPEKAAVMTDEMTIGYIFESGFSTKDVGIFSGRGIGMDVVAQTVKSMNGEIDIRTLSGKGTSISLILPLFSSYIPLTLFSIRDVLFGIPSVYIQSAQQYEDRLVKMVNADHALFLTNEGEVTIIDCADFFGMNNASPGKGEAVILLKYKENLVSLLVDEIILEKKLLIRKVASLSDHMKIIIGAVLLGKERAIPILNVPELFHSLLDRHVTFARDEHYRENKERFGAKTILLVDDSPVTRTREKQILLAQNLNIFEAANGKEAIDILGKNAIDLVVTDLEMPVMNGIEMIRAIREQDTLRELPIVVISSYDNLREEVSSLGVATFINKADFSSDLLVRALKNERMI